jgi:hypothetical protein
MGIGIWVDLPVFGVFGCVSQSPEEEEKQQTGAKEAIKEILRQRIWLYPDSLDWPM